ncbi:hypothetical protein Tco_0969331 [Tanacetum coccineum]
MSSSIHPIIVLSDYDVEDVFSSTHSPDYIPTSPDYFLASPGNISPDPSYDLSKYLLASLAISPFHNDPYMKVMQAYDATNNESPIPLPRQDFNKLETELHEAHAQIAGFQRKQMGHDDKVVLARVRTSTLEILIEDIHIRHRSDIKSLMDKIHKLKGGPPPPDYWTRS